ncbi:hypothetical protein [Novipirellula caenicola]
MIRWLPTIIHQLSYLRSVQRKNQDARNVRRVVGLPVVCGPFSRTSLVTVSRTCAWIAVIAVFSLNSTGWAQNGFQSSNTPISPGVSFGGQSPVDIPQTNLQPMGGGGFSTSPPAASPFPSASSSIGGNFDPYATGAAGLPSYPAPSVPPGTTLGPVQVPGTLLPASRPGGESLFSRIFSNSGSSPIMPTATTGYGASAYGGGSSTTILPPANYGANAYGSTPYGPSPYGAPTYGAPAYGPSGGFDSGVPLSGPAYPSTVYPSVGPTTLFPGGIFGGNGSVFGSSSEFSAYRLLQGPRIRHTFLGTTDEPDSLGVNDTDVSVVFAYQNFLYSSQPLMIAPSFSLHLWDGPETTPTQNADLPSSAYSGFIDLGWQSDPNQILGLELGTRVGVFTDFDTMNSDSLRVMGKGLVNFRLTPASTIKGGVYVLDRIRYNVIPAGGILWQPDPYSRYDIFFPQPKLAHYWRTVGTQDVWWYLGGEYGGGSWTVTRSDNSEQQVDINDYRVMFGLEWGQHEFIQAGRRNAFVEVGYVFDREILYENKANQFDQDDAIMFRAGIGY